MDDKEMRDQLAALERQNAKLKERIAALEAENAALDAQQEGTAADEPADVTRTAKTAASKSKAVGAAAPANGPAPELAPEIVMVRTGGRARTILVGVLVFLTCLAVAVNGFIAGETGKVLSTPQAYDLWIKINRVAQRSIVGLLRGQNNYTYIQRNDVMLDTLPLVSKALVWIDGKLPGALGGKLSPPVVAPGTPRATAIQQVSTWIGRPLPADLGQIRLLKSDSLGPAQKAVRWFDTLVWVIPI